MEPSIPEPPAALWLPGAARASAARLTGYQNWLQTQHGLAFDGYEALWNWSVSDLEAFWRSVWCHFGLHSEAPFERMLDGADMPATRWCEGARVNFAQQVLRHAGSIQPALVYESEGGVVREVGWPELQRQVGALAATLVERGVRRGDRVAGFLSNVPEAVVAFLACASVGAVWSVAAPDMGVDSVVQRFRQIEPVLLVAGTGMRFGGQWRDKREAVQALLSALPSVRTLLLVSHADGEPAAPEDFRHAEHAGLQVASFEEACRGEAALAPEPLPFDHPLWIVYSSGTTGAPKAIVHGHGGIMLMGMVSLALHNDVHADDRLLWMSSTGWIVWNIQVSALLLGATVVLSDAAANWPDAGAYWRLAGRQRVTLFGTGSAFLVQCMKQHLRPRELADLSALRSLGATGSPLPGACYHWAYDAVARDLHLMVVSGGTDICGAFLACAPTLPVYEGQMQCRTLGAGVQAFDETGHGLTLGEVGELVCTTPLPSMPLFFWGDDAQGTLLRSNYFDGLHDGDGHPVWRHGDWMALQPHPEAVGGVIYGRSDATINRHGLRLGSSEIYRAVEAVSEVSDSLVVDLEYLGRPSALLLFVVLREGIAFSAALGERLRAAVRQGVSPRFVPDEIYPVADLPRTLSGKKMELPLRKRLLGQPAAQAWQRDTVANPLSLDWFERFAVARALAQADAPLSQPTAP
ncbi:MAG: acetoacetate--CoA ligase [Burkholderiaceae bacterium]|nr:acetoacetate--CoA ligase [Burkholderiaceae bacterium]